MAVDERDASVRMAAFAVAGGDPATRPIRRRFVIHVGRCRKCGRPEALSVAARLHYELGLSMGKTAAVLQEMYGIKITRAALRRR